MLYIIHNMFQIIFLLLDFLAGLISIPASRGSPIPRDNKTPFNRVLGEFIWKLEFYKK